MSIFPILRGRSMEMIKTEKNTKNKCSFLKKKVKIFSSFLGLFFLLALGQNIFAQGADIEKKNLTKPKKKTTKKATPKKTKATPKKSTTKKASEKRSTSNRKPKRKRTRRNKNSILVTFNSPEPNQEIWRGEEKLGITNSNAILKKWLPKGTYLVSVKEKTGETIVDSALIDVNPENKQIKLEPKIEPPKEVEVQPTAEELLQQKQKEEADAAERINKILANYGNPKKTNTVTLSDWEFISENAKANKIKNFTAIQIEAQRWFSSGQIELAKGKFATANIAFEESAKYMPDSAYPYYGLGESLIANKEYNKALAAYQKAIQISPKFALAHRKIGDILLKLNRAKEAISSYNAALENGLDTPAVRFDLGKAYLKTKRWEDASRELEMVVKEAPTSEVYVTLGDLYTEQKRKISAYEAYKKATELDSNSSQAFYKLGQVLHSEREYERAKIALEKSLELDEKGQEINILLAKKLVREAAEKMK